MAERAAKVDALRQLAAVVGDVQVQAIPGGRQVNMIISRGLGWRVVQAIPGGRQVNIKGFVQGARQLSASFDATDGMAQVALQLPLNGPAGLAAALGYDRAVVEVVKWPGGATFPSPNTRVGRASRTANR